MSPSSSIFSNKPYLARIKLVIGWLSLEADRYISSDSFGLAVEHRQEICILCLLTLCVKDLNPKLCVTFETEVLGMKIFLSLL